MLAVVVNGNSFANLADEIGDGPAIIATIIIVIAVSLFFGWVRSQLYDE